MCSQTTDRTGWLDHPEAMAALQLVLSDLLIESDRGATLIAADMVSNHLDELFRTLAPDHMRSKLKQLLGPSGAIGTFSVKADIAAINGWISEDILKSIHALRKIRNKAAHSNGGFNLNGHKELISNMLEFAERGKDIVHGMAVDILLRNFILNLQESGESLVEKIGENPFDSMEKIHEYMKSVPDWSGHLQDKIPRLSLGLGVTLLLSVIISNRERLIKAE